MANYHYEYYWQSVDLCYGGTKTELFKYEWLARWYKPKRGIWQLKKRRVYN